jgi:hypothetical protein
MFSKKIISFLFVSFLIVTVSHAQCKIYQGRYASGSPVAVTQSGGGACAFAAAAYMLLL